MLLNWGQNVFIQHLNFLPTKIYIQICIQILLCSKKTTIKIVKAKLDGIRAINTGKY